MLTRARASSAANRVNEILDVNPAGCDVGRHQFAGELLRFHDLRIDIRWE